jgi:DNA-directed RNA polymerase specialized sigma24 family protein
VQSALSHIPKRQTKLLLLRQMGLSYAELAEACDVAPGSVGKMLSRAGEAFRRAYQKETSPRNG